MDCWVERIQNLREENNEKQKDVAKILHVSERVVSDYECGHVHISAEYLRILAIHYDVSMDYIMCLTDQKIPLPKK